jgi:thioredoxin 1
MTKGELASMKKSYRKLLALIVLICCLLACSLTPSNTSTPKITATVEPENAVVSQPTIEPDNATVPEPTGEANASDDPYNENAIAATEIENALAKAKQDGKLVLLDFGANWCPDCIALSMFFDDPLVQPYLQENFHIVRIDVGMWDKNLDISEQYGNPIDAGIPAIVVLAPDGEILTNTNDGAMANARSATAQEILDYLKMCVALKP